MNWLNFGKTYATHTTCLLKRRGTKSVVCDEGNIAATEEEEGSIFFFSINTRNNQNREKLISKWMCVCFFSAAMRQGMSVQ